MAKRKVWAYCIPIWLLGILAVHISAEENGAAAARTGENGSLNLDSMSPKPNGGESGLNVDEQNTPIKASHEESANGKQADKNINGDLNNNDGASNDHPKEYEGKNEDVQKIPRTPKDSATPSAGQVDDSVMKSTDEEVKSAENEEKSPVNSPQESANGKQADKNINGDLSNNDAASNDHPKEYEGKNEDVQKIPRTPKDSATPSAGQVDDSVMKSTDEEVKSAENEEKSPVNSPQESANGKQADKNINGDLSNNDAASNDHPKEYEGKNEDVQKIPRTPKDSLTPSAGQVDDSVMKSTDEEVKSAENEEKSPVNSPQESANGKQADKNINGDLSNNDAASNDHPKEYEGKNEDVQKIPRTPKDSLTPSAGQVDDSVMKSTDEEVKSAENEEKSPVNSPQESANGKQADKNINGDLSNNDAASNDHPKEYEGKNEDVQKIPRTPKDSATPSAGQVDDSVMKSTDEEVKSAENEEKSPVNSPQESANGKQADKNINGDLSNNDAASNDHPKEYEGKNEDVQKIPRTPKDSATPSAGQVDDSVMKSTDEEVKSAENEEKSPVNSPQESANGKQADKNINGDLSNNDAASNDHPKEYEGKNEDVQKIPRTPKDSATPSAGQVDDSVMKSTDEEVKSAENEEKSPVNSPQESANGKQADTNINGDLSNNDAASNDHPKEYEGKNEDVQKIPRTPKDSLTPSAGQVDDSVMKSTDEEVKSAENEEKSPVNSPQESANGKQADKNINGDLSNNDAASNDHPKEYEGKNEDVQKIPRTPKDSATPSAGQVDDSVMKSTDEEVKSAENEEKSPVNSPQESANGKQADKNINGDLSNNDAATNDHPKEYEGKNEDVQKIPRTPKDSATPSAGQVDDSVMKSTDEEVKSAENEEKSPVNSPQESANGKQADKNINGDLSNNDAASNDHPKEYEGKNEDVQKIPRTPKDSLTPSAGQVDDSVMKSTDEEVKSAENEEKSPVNSPQVVNSENQHPAKTNAIAHENFDDFNSIKLVEEEMDNVMKQLEVELLEKLDDIDRRHEKYDITANERSAVEVHSHDQVAAEDSGLMGPMQPSQNPSTLIYQYEQDRTPMGSNAPKLPYENSIPKVWKSLPIPVYLIAAATGHGTNGESNSNENYKSDHHYYPHELSSWNPFEPSVANTYPQDLPSTSNMYNELHKSPQWYRRNHFHQEVPPVYSSGSTPGYAPKSTSGYFDNSRNQPWHPHYNPIFRSPSINEHYSNNGFHHLSDQIEQNVQFDPNHPGSSSDYRFNQQSNRELVHC